MKKNDLGLHLPGGRWRMPGSRYRDTICSCISKYMFFGLRNSIPISKLKFGQLEAVRGHPDPGIVLKVKYDDVYQNICFLGSEIRFRYRN